MHLALTPPARPTADYPPPSSPWSPYAPAATGPAHADRTRDDDRAEQRAERQALRWHVGNFLQAVLKADMHAPVGFEAQVNDYSGASSNGGQPLQRPLRVEELIYEEQANQDSHAAWFTLLIRAAKGEDVRDEAMAAVTGMAEGYAGRKVREGV